MESSLDLDQHIPRHVRAINFAGIELLLDLLHCARDFHGDLDLESLAIYLCVSDATMRPFMLDSELASRNMDVPQPPEAIRGSISRRAIADKLGLPRETVRRKTSELAAAGKLFIDENEGVRVGYGLTDTRARTAIEQGHKSILRYIDRLHQFGIHERDVVNSFSR